MCNPQSLNSDPKLVDAATLEFLNEKVLSYFGISKPIYLNKYTEEEFNAFYEGTIEQLSIQLMANPVKKDLKLQIHSYVNNVLNISIISAKGDKVLQKQLPVSMGSSMQNININQLSSGAYYILVTGVHNYQEAIKFSKAGE